MVHNIPVIWKWGHTKALPPELERARGSTTTRDAKAGRVESSWEPRKDPGELWWRLLPGTGPPRWCSASFLWQALGWEQELRGASSCCQVLTVGAHWGCGWPLWQVAASRGSRVCRLRDLAVVHLYIQSLTSVWPFNKWGSWGTKRPSNCCGATQPVRGESGLKHRQPHSRASLLAVTGSCHKENWVWCKIPPSVVWRSQEQALPRVRHKWDTTEPSASQELPERLQRL